MKIALGCDHRGYAAKRDLLPLFQKLDCELIDFGCYSFLGVDYADIAYPLALAVGSHECDLGVLIDCNGIGMTIVANKVRGVRAATVHDAFTARCARENHHCNIIGIGADLIGTKDVSTIVEAFLQATVSAGRHTRRLEKLNRIEESMADVHLLKGIDPATFTFGVEVKNPRQN